MRQLFNLIFLFAAIIAGLQTHAQVVRPPIEANTVRALNELDARKTMKFRGDSLVKSEMAYIEWDDDCFRFRRITTGAAWSDWLCIDDGEQTTIGVNAQSAFEIISNAINFKVQNKHTVLQSDAGNNFLFKGNVILGENFTALGFGAGQSGYDSLVGGGDTILVPAFDNQFDNVILVGHGAQERADNTAVIGDSSLVRIWTAAAVDASALEIKGDSVFLRHLVNLVEADSGKIAMHNGSGVVWIPQKADSIQINGEWVELGGAFSFSDSIQVNGVWVHLGGSFTTPDAQNLSWNPETGALGISGGTGVDLDGRYLQTETPQNLSWNPETGALGIDGGTGVDLDGRYLVPPTATDGQMMIYGSGSWYATAPIDERVSVINSEGAKSAPALLYADDFSVSQVGGAVDDWVVSVKPDSIYSEVAGAWIKKGDSIPAQEFELFLQQNAKWISSGDTIPTPVVSANIGGATLLGNFDLSDTITHQTGFSGTVLTLLSWNGNTIEGFTNEGGYLTANENLNLTVNQNYKVDRSQDSFIESVLFLEINQDMFELPYTSGNESQGTWNSGTMSFAITAGDEVRAHVFSRWIGTPIPAPEYTYVTWTGYMTAIKSVVGDIVEYDPLSIHKTDTLFYVSDGTTAEPVLQGDTIAKTGTLGMKDIWTGTQAQYDLIGTPDPNTVYFINNGWWALAFLLLFSFSGFGQKWDAVKIGSTDIVRIYQGAELIWEKESEEDWTYEGVMTVGFLDELGTDSYGYSLGSFGSITPSPAFVFDAGSIVFVDADMGDGLRVEFTNGGDDVFNGGNIILSIDGVEFELEWDFDTSYLLSLSVNPFPPVGQTCAIKLRYTLAPAPTFPEVTIGTQTWMSVNLDIDDGLGGIYAYNNDEANVATYGRLYTWDAAVRVAASIDGWHLPSKAEFETLVTFLGGASVAGGKLKETGFEYWDAPNTGATNESGFGARGGGSYVYGDRYSGIAGDENNYTNIISSTMTIPDEGFEYSSPYVLGLQSNKAEATIGGFTDLTIDEIDFRFSVRLIKNTP